MKPTDEQKKEFWELCGIVYKEDYIINEYGDKHIAWLCPDGEIWYICPPIDSNNLFKYAVPKLQERGHTISLEAYEHKGYCASVSDLVFNQRGSDGEYYPYSKPISSAENEDPALALFWAIYLVLKGKINEN